MKTPRLILKFSILMILLATALIGPSLFGGPGLLQAAPFSGSAIVRVYFDDPETARQIAIWIEPLESKYEKGYLVLEVSAEEYDRLVQAGLQVEIDETRKAQMAAAVQGLQPVAQEIPGFPCYRTVEETFATAESIVISYPELATWTDVGDSWEKENGLGGYDLMVLKLTNITTSDPDDPDLKPKIFITSAIHAREYTTAELMTRMAEYLVNNYGTDADATWLLDHHEIHLMLQANPDGRKQAETGLSWRKNTNQNYCSPTSNNRGADLNRNFDYRWGCCGGSSGNECNLTYRGPFAASEPEAQAVQSYIEAQFPDQREPDDLYTAAADGATGIYLDIHSSGRLILWPWGFTDDPAPNGTQLQTLGRKLAYFNGHTPEQGIGLYPTDGTTTSFAYGTMGLAAFTYELGTEFFESCSYFENTLVPENLPSLIYAIKVARTPYMTPAGPDALNLALSLGATPPGVATGTNVTLRATINDTRYNNSNGTEPTQNIAAAEYYVDVPPWSDNPAPIGVSMAATDGSFNSSVESVTAAIDTSGLNDGQHIIYLRGRDSAGNWGAFSAVFLYIQNTPCTIDSECDDGEFCNGVETCGANNFCQAGSDPCPGEVCDETTDQCEADPVFAEDFESGNVLGWALYAAGSTARTGDWEIGDPNGTYSGGNPAQPEDALAGEGCGFTAQNSSLGSDDVDAGVVYLESPAIDLSRAAGAQLNYDRWFFNRDTGEDSGDFFVVEASDNNGATWVNLETLNTNQNANSWSTRTFDLENYIGMTATVRVRFGAADGSSQGNIIEAALDNVTIQATGGCEVDADCDDGQFCNGAEICLGGVCQPGDDPCPGEGCDETGSVCLPAGSCLYSTEFEAGAGGWTNGADSCTTGSFVVGSPDATAWQVGGGNPGLAFFTQPNPGGIGTDDVDGGTCEALSPLVDCAGQEAAEVSLDYYHGQRDAGDDAGDGFTIEVLNDDVVVDTIVSIGDVTSNAAWTSISTVVTDPGSIQIRVRATDAAATGDIVEGGIDNVSVSPTTPPPACTVDDDFESGASGWTNHPASTCSTGDYVLGNPTNPGGGQQIVGSYSGANSLFTAVNTSAGTNDVDGGNCILASPSWMVSETSILSVWYWHGQRDAGDDAAGDFFFLEYSTNGGSSWTTLASNGDAASSAVWSLATAPIPADSTVELRVQCSDGAGPGDLVECDIDDISICPQ